MVMLPNVARAIDRLSVPVSRIRRVVGAYNADGIYIEGLDDVAAIMAAIQPATGNKLMDLPEGIRAEARWLCWSRSDIELDDVISHSGITYRVMYCWPRDEGGFYRAAIGRDVK